MDQVLARKPEPELMDAPAQARAYADADFAAPHDAFVAAIAARFGPLDGTVVDLGCGPADVTVRFARANPNARIVGVDAGPNMLALATERVEAAGLTDRIGFEHRHLPDAALAGRNFDVVISNSLLHHLDDATALWETVRACARPGAPVAVMDLLRPATPTELDSLVARYVADEPPVLRDDFRNSLAAAYRPDEIRSQLDVAALDDFVIDVTSDRHLLVTGLVPMTR